MVAPSAGEASRRRRGELLDASPATARRVVFLLWGGASADPASLHDDDEGASWPSLVLQTSRVDGVEAFRRVCGGRRRGLISDAKEAFLAHAKPAASCRFARARQLKSLPLVIPRIAAADRRAAATTGQQ